MACEFVDVVGAQDVPRRLSAFKHTILVFDSWQKTHGFRLFSPRNLKTNRVDLSLGGLVAGEFVEAVGAK